MSEDGHGRLRLDKWLWYARFFKSRSIAAQRIAAGGFRINRDPVRKSHQTVKAGDVLTFPQGRDIRSVEVAALGLRRGPASEARELYRDLAPPVSSGSADAGDVAGAGGRGPGAGRPTKRDRRALDRFRDAG